MATSTKGAKVRPSAATKGNATPAARAVSSKQAAARSSKVSPPVKKAPAQRPPAPKPAPAAAKAAPARQPPAPKPAPAAAKAAPARQPPAPKPAPAAAKTAPARQPPAPKPAPAAAKTAPARQPPAPKPAPAAAKAEPSRADGRVFRVIGQRVEKVDALERVTGQAVFGADIALPDMLWAKVLRSPYAHARIKRIDFTAALHHPGVRAVVTAAHLPPLESKGALQTGEVPIDVASLRELVLASKKVRFHGQPVAAVAATDPYTAAEALELIRVDYEPLPVVESALEAMKPGAPLVHDDLYTQSLGEKARAASNVATHIQLERGDVQAGFGQAAVVVEESYETAMVHQGYLEPQAAAASVDAAGRVTVWTTTQGAFTTKLQLCAILGLSHSRVRVVPLEVGGGFGGKISVVVEPLCVLLARQTGRPVKLVLTRDEVLRATGPGCPSFITLKAGAKKDGTLTAIVGRLVYDAGAFPGAPVAAGCVAGSGSYRVPNLRLEGYDVVTNKPRVQAYRAPGAPQAAFAFESIMDQLAEKLGLDPLELRRRNATGEGDPLANDQTLPRVGLKQLLERVAKHPCWTRPLPEEPGRARGRGLALGCWLGAALTSSCHLLLNADGSVVLNLGSVDLTGTRTAMAQIVAEELRLEPDRVQVRVADTDTVGYNDVSAGSRTTYVTGAAVRQACQDVLGQLKARAAERLEVPADQVEFRDGAFAVTGAKKKGITYLELARTSLRRGGPVMGRGTAAGLPQAPAYAAHVVEVEVDRSTGKVSILKYTAFQDVGRAVNPTQVEGQIQGAVAQGVGWALTEGYSWHRGVLRNPSLLDYRMPTALDLPFIAIELVQVPAAAGPYGVRGVGEVPIVPPTAAIANAIYRAVGVRLKALPMTPEAIFMALQGPEVKPAPVAAVAARR
ncbi:MAG: xanthine dehydrogenase family protein molybdopterin-binding subunit [Chloroflexi bacterium]|nr:xanthine dehydrogenase family protein molybdopterin-binding subunit [Chloroflexota bacterium]